MKRCECVVNKQDATREISTRYLIECYKCVYAVPEIHSVQGYRTVRHFSAATTHARATLLINRIDKLCTTETIIVDSSSKRKQYQQILTQKC